MRFKRIIFLFVCIAGNTVLLSQYKANRKYFQNINQAELCIAANELDSAICRYTGAIEHFGGLMAKDEYNLMLCYIKQGNLAKAKNLFQSLINKGAKKEWLVKNRSVFNAFANWPDADSSVNVPEVYKLPRQSLQDTLSGIYETDQQYRKKANAYAKFKEEIRKSDSLNICLLKSVIKNYNGLPPETFTGINDESLIFQPFYTHILHQSQGVKQHDYSQLLLAEMLNGNINPQIGAYLYMRTSGDFTFFGPVALLQLIYPSDSVSSSMFLDQAFVEEYSRKIPWLIYNYPDSLKAKKDSVRVKYGLETISQFEQKALFQMNQGEFIFYYLPYLRNFFVCKTKEDADKIGVAYRRAGIK